jgi:hypothetical protein
LTHSRTQPIQVFKIVETPYIYHGFDIISGV